VPPTGFFFSFFFLQESIVIPELSFGKVSPTIDNTNIYNPKAEEFVGLQLRRITTTLNNFFFFLDGFVTDLGV
jgi:hypothetical protein